MYNELIRIDIDALDRNKSNDARKHNILMILNNVEAIFTGAYVHYKEVPKKTVFEKSIAERSELRKDRFSEIKRKQENLNNELFKAYFTEYESPSSMYNKLINSGNVRINKSQVDSIKKTLTRMKKSIKKVPKKYDFRIKENEEIIYIVERILELNNKIQSRQGLKILTPNQMLSRLPITLAQLKAGNNSEQLKNEVRQLLYSLYRSKKLAKNIYERLINII